MPLSAFRLHGQASLIVAVLALSAGCVNYSERLEAQAHASGRSSVVIRGGAYPIQAVLPMAVQADLLRVYIEGDGHAWATSSQPSTDPTPHENLVADLASSDPSGAVYLARPCQFVRNDRCSPLVWTDGRFGQAVIKSMSSVLDVLKVRYSAKTFELIGYSGGGAVALLVASKRDDVASVQTLAGNIAVTAWSQLHSVSPLTGSLDPVDFADRLRGIPQRHLIGDSDEVVPRSVALNYLSKLGATGCVEVVTVHASHQDGWSAAWKRYSELPTSCTP